MTPIPITRAEYEKKFGVKPVTTGTSVLDDEEPAPIRITRAEWNALQTQWNPQPKTYAQDAMSDVAETKQSVLATADRGAQKSGEISQRVASGETSKAKGMFQKFGNSLLSTGEMAFNVGIGAVKTILPQKAEDSVKKFFEGFGNEITAYNKDFYEKKVLPDLQSSDPDKKASAKVIVETLDAYKNDADFRDTVNASGGIASALFSTKIKDGVSKTVYTGIGVGKGTLTKADDLFTPIKKNFDERGINNVVKEIDQIENKYVKTRNANTYSKDTEASQRRIAEANVLDGAVDNDGVIRTKGEGGAIDQYKVQTIDGYEDIVKRKLQDTKETMPFADVKRALVREVGSSGLEGADLVTALKKVEKELEGLSVRTKGSSIIDLSYLHDAKIATTKNINYLTPPEKATYRKAVARAYKKLVEDNSTKFDVKAVNEGPLARAYEDIARLERLDGARAQGGRLGKYTASLAGTGIGMAVGSIGGPIGTAVGGVIGGEASQALKGAGMSRTFKGGGKGLTPDPLLVQTKLSIPDKPVKAGQGVVKTKEISALESQIAENVTKQKKAIKEGDFELVKSLKEIYAVLVDDLKQSSRTASEAEK